MGTVDGPTNEKPAGLQMFYGVGIGILLAAAVATALTIAKSRAENSRGGSSASAAIAGTAAPKLLAGVPTIAIDNPDGVTAIQITRDKDAPIKLEKKTGGWRIVAPMDAKADDEVVQSFLAATKTWGLGTAITPASEADKVFANERAHIVVQRGSETAIDLSVGGENALAPKLRVAGHPETYEAVAFPKGLLAKDLNDWRDHTILRIDADTIDRILIENAHGTFELNRVGQSWKGARSAASEDFNPSRVDDLLHAVKTIQALGFAQSDVDTGLDKPAVFGGQMKFFAKGATDPAQITIGKAAKGGRYAAVSGSDDVYVVSGWVADWATADASKFAHK